MGNELFGKYSLEKNSFLTGGHLNLWKIYNATHKERKTPVCVFVFDKKVLENYPQNEREDLLKLLRKEATSLVKFKHPNILSIIEPLTEDKYSLGFITESFSYSLSSWLKIYKPSNLEIKLVVKQITKTVEFLQDNCHIIHAGLNPDCIFLNNSYQIKISGMNYSTCNEVEGSNDIKYNLNYFSSALNQNINYVAPEIVFQSKVNNKSDIFSIGAICYFLFTKSGSELISQVANGNKMENYKRAYSYIEEKISDLQGVDEEDKELLYYSTRLYEERLDIKHFTQLNWFNENKLKALCYVENLATNDIVKNYEFLKQLPEMIKIFDRKVVKNHILPSLLQGLSIESLINPILPAIFFICEIKDIDINFQDIIWPKLKQIFKLNPIPAASLYFLLSKMAFIGEKISSKEFTSHYIPIICKSMDCGLPKIQGVIVDNLNVVSQNINSPVFCTQIYPRIIQIILHTKSLTLKLRLLMSLRSLYSLLDKKMLNENLLNDLQLLRKKDSSPSVSAAIELIYEEIVNKVSIDAITQKVIPNLISLMMEGKISQTTFAKISTLIQKYINRLKGCRQNELTDNDDFEEEEIERAKDQNSVKFLKPELMDNQVFLQSFFDSNSNNSNKNKKKENNIFTINSPEQISNNNTLTSIESDLTTTDDIFDGLNSLNIKSNTTSHSVKNQINFKSKTIVDKLSEQSQKINKIDKENKKQDEGVFDSLLNEFEEDSNENIIKKSRNDNNYKEDKIKEEFKQSKEKEEKEVNCNEINLSGKTNKRKGWESDEEDDENYSFEKQFILTKIEKTLVQPKQQTNEVKEEPQREKKSMFKKNNRKKPIITVEEDKEEKLSLESLLDF